MRATIRTDRVDDLLPGGYIHKVDDLVFDLIDSPEDVLDEEEGLVHADIRQDVFYYRSLLVLGLLARPDLVGLVHAHHDDLSLILLLLPQVRVLLLFWEVVVSNVSLDAFYDEDIAARKEHPWYNLEYDCTLGNSIGDPDLIVVEIQVILRPIDQPERLDIFRPSPAPSGCRRGQFSTKDAIDQCHLDKEVLLLLFYVVHIGQAEIDDVEVDALIILCMRVRVEILDVCEVGGLDLLPVGVWVQERFT